MQVFVTLKILFFVQDGSVIWSNEVKGDIDSHLSSMVCNCSQGDAASYVEPCSRHYFYQYHHNDDDIFSSASESSDFMALYKSVFNI